MGSSGLPSISIAAKGQVTRLHLLACVSCVAALLISTTASAVDGCEVLLCLAAPSGWNKIAQCVPPMESFLKDMVLGKAFPSCALAGDPKTGIGSFAQPMATNFYNQCPDGTQALPKGSFAIMSPIPPPTANQAAWVLQQQLLAGIGDGSQYTPNTGVPVSLLPPEICVFGAPTGVVSYPMSLVGVQGIASVATVNIPVPVYSSVTILQPNTSNNVIGVWINGQLYNQVHW